MSQRFTVRVRRGLHEISAVYRDTVMAKTIEGDPDVRAALRWIEEHCVLGITEAAEEEEKEKSNWFTEQFGKQ